MDRHALTALKGAAPTALISFVLFVYSYMRFAEPFNPQPVPFASAPALLLGLPIAALTFVITFGVIFILLEHFDNS